MEYELPYKGRNLEITGVMLGHALNGDAFLEEIDFEREIAVKELKDDILEVIKSKGYSTYAFKDGSHWLSEELDIFVEEVVGDRESEVVLIGDWVEKSVGVYAPDKTGDFSAIYDRNTNYVQVVWSTHYVECGMCSPCFPGQGDVDSLGRERAYIVPPEFLNDEYVAEMAGRIKEV